MNTIYMISNDFQNKTAMVKCSEVYKQPQRNPDKELQTYHSRNLFIMPTQHYCVMGSDLIDAIYYYLNSSKILALPITNAQSCHLP